MKKLLPLLLLALVACNKNKNTPTEPVQPSYVGLPIASYTVTSTTALQPSGTIPVGSSVSFSSTASRRNQLTAGTSATLTLSGARDIKIRSITLHMRSNKSAGAGSLAVTSGGTPVWTIDNADFKNPAWHGSYTTDTVSVFHLFEPYLVASEPLQITIAASVNSLYIMRYDIEYEPAETRPLTRDSALVSGYKVITFPRFYRLTGQLQDRYVYVKSDTLPITNEDVYEVTFFADSAATLYHPSSQTYIGCHKGQLDKQATLWSVSLSSDTTFTFYLSEGGVYYELLPDADNGMNLFLFSVPNFMCQRWTLRSYK